MGKGRSEEAEGRSEQNFLQKYIMGDLACVNEWFEDKPIPLQFPNWILRAYGTPIFINNPLSGAFILAGTFVGNWWCAVTSLIAVFVAIVTALLMGMDRGAIGSGGATFHGLLIGIVLGATFQKDASGDPLPMPYIVIMVILLASASVPIASGLGNIAGAVGIPAFNFPFNIITFVWLASLGRGNPHWPNVDGVAAATGSPTLDNNVLVGIFANKVLGTYDWADMFLAVPCSMAQIYGSDSYIAGALVLCGVALCSPLFLIHAVLAAVISIFMAYGIAAPSAEIAAGVWSYNAVLSTMCLGGFFYVPSIFSSVLALFSAMFSVLIHGAMGSILAASGAPVVAIPFNISAGILVAATSNHPSLKRVPMDEITYPEDHYKRFGCLNRIADGDEDDQEA